MTLSQLIEYIGNDKVDCQFLSKTVTKVKANKDGSTSITFDTKAVNPIDLISNQQPKIGVVIWLPTDKWNEAKEVSKKVGMEGNGVHKDVSDLAGKLYDQYCQAVGGKAFNGDALPDWKTFYADASKKKQSDAWIAVACCARNWLYAAQ